MTSFGVYAQQHDACWRLRVTGELDMVTAEEFAREVDRVDAAEDTTVVLDLNRVSFIDVSGLRALLDACAVLAEQGVRRRGATRRPPARPAV